MPCLDTWSWAACSYRRTRAGGRVGRVGPSSIQCRAAPFFSLTRASQAFQGWSKYLGLQAGHRLTHHLMYSRIMYEIVCSQSEGG